jgi:hypothetical protein
MTTGEAAADRRAFSSFTEIQLVVCLKRPFRKVIKAVLIR